MAFFLGGGSLGSVRQANPNTTSATVPCCSNLGGMVDQRRLRWESFDTRRRGARPLISTSDNCEVGSICPKMSGGWCIPVHLCIVSCVHNKYTKKQKTPSKKNPQCSFVHLHICAPAKEITALGGYEPPQKTMFLRLPFLHLPPQENIVGKLEMTYP